MGLFEQINEDIKVAMKSKNKDKLESLRAIKSQLLIAKTAEGATEEISEAQGTQILQKMVKQRKEAATIYEQQNRKDLSDKELLEVSYIEAYLPAFLSDEELTNEVNKIIQQTGAKSPKDMGKVMGLATKQLQGKAEGKNIADKVKEQLNKMA